MYELLKKEFDNITVKEKNFLEGQQNCFKLYRYCNVFLEDL